MHATTTEVQSGCAKLRSSPLLAFSVLSTTVNDPSQVHFVFIVSGQTTRTLFSMYFEMSHKVTLTKATKHGP